MVLENNLKLDFDIDIELTNSKSFNLLKEFIIENYPNFIDILNHEGILEAYLQPKTVQYLQMQQEYREHKYPTSGVEEIAYTDICYLIKSDIKQYSNTLIDIKVTL